MPETVQCEMPQARSPSQLLEVSGERSGIQGLSEMPMKFGAVIGAAVDTRLRLM